MKRILILISIVSLLFASCAFSSENTYSREEIAELEYEAYKRGYDEAMYQAKSELERTKSEYNDGAYEHGYEIGYEDGYNDCLYEYGLVGN